MSAPTSSVDVARHHDRVGVIPNFSSTLGMWWLVEATNKEGTHDAELLPFFALIPLSTGAYHLLRSRLQAR